MATKDKSYYVLTDQETPPPPPADPLLLGPGTPSRRR
jgi:hypothetical protein